MNTEPAKSRFQNTRPTAPARLCQTLCVSVRGTIEPVKFQFRLRLLLLLATILVASFATWSWWVTVPIETADSYLENLTDPKAGAWSQLVQQHPNSGWSTDFPPTINYVELRKRSMSQKLRGTAEYLVTLKDSRTSDPSCWLNFRVSVEGFNITKAELEAHPKLVYWANGFR